MGWVANHLAEFSLRPSDELVERGRRVAELAITAYCHVEFAGGRRRRDLDRIVAHLRDVRSLPWLRDVTVRVSGEVVLLAMLNGCLTRLGYPDDELRWLLRRAADAGRVRWLERPPHRVMDVRMALEWSGVDPPFAPMETLVANSILADAPPPVLLDEAATYQVTHVVMFITRFGTRPDGAALLPAPEQLRETLLHLIVAWARRGHWDLLTELLFCWECLRFGWDDVVEFGWACVLEALDDDGSVPASRDPGVDRSFPARYHTTLASILAGCLFSHRTLSETGAARGRAGASGRNAGVDSSRAAGAIESASAWFASLSAQGPMTAEDVCDLVVGASICQTFAASERLEDTIADALRLLADAEARAPARSYVACLAAAVIARRAGVDIAFLEHAARDAADAVTHRSTAAADPALFEPVFLLSLLGLADPPPSMDREAALGVVAGALARQEEGAVPLAADAVTAATLGGAVGQTFRDTWMPQRLEAEATAALAVYDLPLGCRLVRAAAYTGASGPALRQLLDFVLLQQRHDGSFGYFAVAESHNRGDVARTGRLAVTVGCVRAIVESVAPSLRLLPVLAEDRAGLSDI